jgi:thymidylate kinase
MRLETLRELDQLLDARVAVIGPCAPQGPIDLLALPKEASLLASWLGGRGFIVRGDQWVRFVGCSFESCRLIPVAPWGLPAGEIARMFSEGLPLGRFDNLVRLDPEHALLVAAQRLVEEDSPPMTVLRQLVNEAVARHAGAWTEARASSSVWGLTYALDLLLRFVDTRPPSPVQRARARAELRGVRGAAYVRPSTTAPLRGRRRGGRGGVIALSGVDGAGKTSQAIALQETLGRLEVHAVIEWTRLAINPSLNVIGLPVKSLLMRFQKVRGGEQQLPMASEPVMDSATAFRKRHRIVNFLWVTIVTLANALAQRRSTVRHLRKGYVVIRDRYALDSAVQLHYAYGNTSGFRLQMWLLRHVPPKPRCAVLLDVKAEEALARKAEQYGLDDLRYHAELYRELHGRFGVRCLDGGRPREELCELIAAAVWRSLPRPTR